MYPLPAPTTELGTLDLLRTYIEYDFPQLFSAADTEGNLYLALHVEEPPRPDTWLYVPMTRARLTEIEKGHADLHSSIRAPERSYLFRVILGGTDTKPVVDRIAASEIPERWLPGVGEKLSSDRTLDGSDIASSRRRYGVPVGPSGWARVEQLYV